MIILCIRTDKQEAELYILSDNNEIGRLKWLAHRELSTTLHKKIDGILAAAGITPKQLGGVLIYKGPGSFTGLRIGFSVANALAFILKIPILAVGGEGWRVRGSKRIVAGENERIAQPEYGGSANITLPKK